MYSILAVLCYFFVSNSNAKRMYVYVRKKRRMNTGYGGYQLDAHDLFFYFIIKLFK